MTLYSNRILSALTFGTMVVFGSAQAAPEADKKSDPAAQNSDRAPQKAERKAAPKAGAGRSQDQLDTCKHDAHGKQGPERANFMTDCLKSR